MTATLVAGTKENLIVDVTDRLENLTTLDGANGTFDVRLKGETSWEIQGQAIINIGMRAFCLVDTDTLDVGVYELFLNFQSLPEEPRIGPIEFEVAHA
jgi:hypothetical protein